MIDARAGFSTTTAFAKLALATTAIGLALPLARPAEAQQPTIKIGFVATFSGPGGVLGRDIYDGFMLGLKQSGGTLGGAKVEVLKEDDQLKPDVGVQLAQKLIEKDKVDAVVGVVFSNVLMAMYKPVVDSKTFLISLNAGPSPTAGAQCSPFFFAASWQNDQMHEAMGKHLQDKGIKRAVLMAPNYQAGKDALTGVKRYYKGEVAEELYTTVNQPDYAAELAQLRVLKPDAVYGFYPGGMGVNFVKQYAQAGLTRSIPFYSAFTIDASTIEGQGDAALGTFGTSFWTADLDNAANKAFVPAHEAEFKRLPSPYSAQGYDAARWMDAALKATGGSMANKDAVRDALRAAKFDSVRGTWALNKNHYPIQDFYLYETVKDDKGRLVQVNRGKVFANHGDAYAKDCPMSW